MNTVCRPESNNPACFDGACFNYFLQHLLRVRKQIRCRCSYHLILKDLREFACEFPADKKWCPVNIGYQLCKWIFIKYPNAGEFWHRRRIRSPVDGRATLNGLRIRNKCATLPIGST